MTIDPTRKEWQEAYERVRIAYLNRNEAHGLTAAALGPSPPEPAPEPWQLGGMGSLAVGVAEPSTDARIVARNQQIAQLTPDEADAMACSLIEHAAYAREQEATPSRNAPVAGPLIPAPICGRALGGVAALSHDPTCVRPKGHAGVCSPHRRAGDARG